MKIGVLFFYIIAYKVLDIHNLLCYNNHVLNKKHLAGSIRIGVPTLPIIRKMNTTSN